MDKKRITITFLIVLTNSIGAAVFLPMLPLYVERQFGATPLQATLVIAAFYAAQLVAAPWLGRQSDRRGRRPILIVSQIGTIAAYLMFVLAVPLGVALEGSGVTLGMSGGLAIIFIGRILDGLTGGNISVAEAYASDISDQGSRAQALGLVGGASGLGHILGPAVAVILSGVSLIAPILAAAVMSAVTLVLTIVLLDESPASKQRLVANGAIARGSTIRLLVRHPVLLVFSTAFSIGLYIAAAMSTFSLYAERVLFPGEAAAVVIQNTGIVMIVMGLMAALCQMTLLGHLVQRFGEQALIVSGGFLLLVSALGFASATGLPAIVIATIAYALGYGIAWPSLQSIVTRFGSQGTAGGLLGLFQSTFSLALIVGPVVAGLVLESSGARAIHYGGAGLIGVAIFLGVMVFHLPLVGDTDRSMQVEARPGAHAFPGRLHH